MIAGCSENLSTVEVVEVSGVETFSKVKRDNPIKLVVSGIDNIVKVLLGTPVVEIEMTGINSTVYLPSDVNPKTKISGTDNKSSNIDSMLIFERSFLLGP